MHKRFKEKTLFIRKRGTIKEYNIFKAKKQVERGSVPVSSLAVSPVSVQRMPLHKHQPNWNYWLDIIEVKYSLGTTCGGAAVHTES